MREEAVFHLGIRSHEERRARLSFPQERLWLFDQIAPLNGAYNLSVALRIVGPLNVAALRQALNEIVRRHEVLRTAFTDDGLHGAHIVFASAPLDFPVLDIGSLTSVERAKECCSQWGCLRWK